MKQFAVIGAGYPRPNLIHNFSQIPGVRVAYVCDLDPAKLAPPACPYPTLTTTLDYADALYNANRLRWALYVYARETRRLSEN